MVIICIMLIWCFSCLFDYAPTTRLLASWIQEFILFHAVPQCPEQCLVHSKVSINIHVLNESIHIPNHFTSLLKPLAASRCPQNTTHIPCHGPVKSDPCLLPPPHLILPPLAYYYGPATLVFPFKLFALFRPLHLLLFLFF